MSKSKSTLLSVVVEPDTEAPDDENAWAFVLACEGDIPIHFGGGYLHPPKCGCHEAADGALCDVGWLEEFVSCAGVSALIEPYRLPHLNSGSPFRIKLTGRMVSERFDSIEGTDYDERFDVENTEVMS